jgi:hypothetical protein
VRHIRDGRGRRAAGIRGWVADSVQPLEHSGLKFGIEIVSKAK